mgnify:CR=1 FL=1
MSTLKTPFRYDFVGSFLRPEKLKEAKKNFEEGKITQDELDKITDECVSEVVAKQKAAGFHAITDGEFRRRYWHLDFLADLDGVEEIKAYHSRELNMRKMAVECSLMGRLQILKQLILLERLRLSRIHL